MKKDEQLDALQIDVLNLCTAAQDKLIGDTNEQVLGDYLNQLTMTVNRFSEEFEINIYEIAGMLEAIKLDLLMDEEKIAPDVVGVLDTVKLGILIGDGVSFESDIDLDDDEFMDIEDLD